MHFLESEKRWILPGIFGKKPINKIAHGLAGNEQHLTYFFPLFHWHPTFSKVYMAVSNTSLQPMSRAYPLSAAHVQSVPQLSTSYLVNTKYLKNMSSQYLCIHCAVCISSLQSMSRQSPSWSAIHVQPLPIGIAHV